MKVLLSSIALSWVLGAASAMAADPAATHNSAAPVSSKTEHSLKHCEKDAAAKNLTGEARIKFIKECRDGKQK